MTTLKIKINNPLYGTFCYIDERIINKALKEKKLLEITIPQGTSIEDPIKWKKGKLMEKVFMYPDNPMKLRGRYVGLELKTPKPKLESQLSLL